MQMHQLKTDKDVFDQVWEGTKTFEIRKNDRDYQLGDLLILRETVYSGEQMSAGQPLFFTGRRIECAVTSLLLGPIYGLQDSWCIMSIKVRHLSRSVDSFI